MKMITTALLVTALLGIQAKASFAGEGSPYECVPEDVAVKAAVGVLMADGHSAPLTHEAYSLSSDPQGYGVILSYSGVQFTYFVSVDQQSCRVLKVELKQ